MNKKIDLWVLLLIVWLGLVFTIVFSWSVRSQLVGSHRAGFFGELAEKVAALPANAYSLFKERTSDPPLIIKNRWPEIDHFKKNGVLYSGVLKDDGYLLLPAYNNGKGQSTVQLIRIKDQKLLHEWTPDLSEIKRVHKNSDLSNFPINFDVSTPFKASRFRSLHPLLLDDGGILYGSGLFLIKSTVCDSIVVVVKQYKHHSAEMAPDGSVWVPTTIYPTSYDTIISEYRDDAITNVSMDGKILFVKSVSQILEENGYRSLLFGVGTIETDPIHLNDIQPAFYSSKYWKKDDLLISIRNKSTIFLYRPKINKIIWLKTGPWLHQHDVDFIGNSKVSVFSNNSIDSVGSRRMLSANNDVYIYDFKENSVSTPYAKIFKTEGICTITEGQSEILDNGDVFIDESNNGRLLRLSPDSVRWEFTATIDSSRISMLSWSRYLTYEQIKDIIPILMNADCNKSE